MSEVVGVPAGLIMKVHPKEIEVFVSSETECNPYEKGEKARLKTGLYCETVMAQRGQLLVSDACKDPQWDHNPDIKLNMVSYLGLPLIWPDGEIFGTICVLDNKENPYSAIYQKLLAQFREAVENDLQMVLESEERYRQTEEEPRRTAQEWGTTFDSITDLVSIHDKDFKIVRANKSLTDTFNMKPKEIIGKNCYELMHGTKEPPSFCPHKQALETGKPHCTEVFEPRLGIYVEISASPIFDENGRTIATAHIVKDITDRKKAEEKVQQQNEFLNTVLESLTHPFYVINANDYTIKMANTAANMGELSEKTICYMLTHKRDKPCEGTEHICPLEEAKKTKRLVTVEHVHYDKDGNPRNVEVNAYPIFDSSGNVCQVIEYTLDITKRKKAEEEKTTLKAQLHQTQKMEAIGTLASGIAHDFNNILTAMVGYADLALEDAREGTVAQNYLQQVLTAGSRAKELVRQILTFSRKTEQEQEPMEIAPIVKEALKMLRSSIPTTIEIRQNIQADSSVIMANPTEIHQILVNLCTNAAHAMGENGGLLEVSLTDVDIEPAIVTDFGTLQEGSYLKLSVKDTGCGMNREVMGRIFEPFFTTKDVDKGTGMGLSMVHGIVESYGGLITVGSEPGKGTTFNVFFPRINCVDMPETESLEVVCGRGELVLLVDDEKPIVDMMTQMLQRLGYVVVGETSSVDALETFRTQADKFDLVITDYAMPNITGKQLAKELMSIRPDIPIILCTGFNDDIDAERAKSIGIKEFIMKPIDRKNMAVIIRNILDKKEIRV